MSQIVYTDAPWLHGDTIIKVSKIWTALIFSWEGEFMRKLTIALVVIFLAGSWGVISYAETWTPLRGRVELKDRPLINGRVLATVPAKARLKELDRRGYWIKAEYQGSIGWVPMTAVRLVTGEEKPEIEVIHAQTKVTGRRYKHIFKIRNTGTAPFSGAVTLKGFISDKQAFKKTFTFGDQPIPARQEREAVINIEADFSKLDYTVKR